MGSRRLPEAWLQLEWVFGYNGHTARNNVKVNNEGHLLYYVAGVGVLHDTSRRKQTFYTGHNDDITSLAVTGDGTTAATGQVGKDAYITVWDASTCAALSVIREGHTHRVSTLAFSTDMKLLASVGGPNHRQELMVWEWRKGRRLACNVAYSGKVEEVEWEPGSASRLVTCGHNHVKFWKLSGNVLQGRSGVFGSEATTDQLSLSHLPGDRLVTGTASGHLYVWQKSKVTSAIKDVHPGGVLVTEVYPGGLLTGGRDGTIALFDKQLNKVATVPEAPSLVYEIAGPIHSLAVYNEKIIIGTEKNEVWTVRVEHDGGLGAACVVQGHGLGELWGLATHPTRPLAITASDDCTVRLWDLEERRPLATVMVEREARAAAFSPNGQHAAVGLIQGMFVVLQAEHLEEQCRVCDRKEVRHDLKYSPSGAFLAVASNDNFVDIYQVESSYQRIHVLQGASSFITHLDWSSDDVYIQLNSGASERLIYHVSKEAVVDESNIPEVEWSTWTGVLGPQVAGIWHKYADTSDVNTCDANFYFGLLVTGDDYGLVKLFRFPCPKRGSKGRSFVGHSAHVTNVRWTSDSEYVVSVGGADHAVFLWRFRSSRRISAPPEQRVRLPSALEGESDDDVLDTEDELEGIPELTLDLEDELTESKSKIRRQQKKKTREDSVLEGVEIADDSTFTRRRKATSTKSERNAPPTQSLHMKHVFGFRAHECRNNAHWLKSGHVVYHIAAIGIVCDPSTRAQRHYLHHTDDILCLALHPEGELVASGQVGREATVHVWDAMEVRVMSVLQGGHSRGVTSVAFSADGQRVASLGLDDHHTLVIWNWRKGYKLASARSHSGKVFGLQFSRTNSNRLVTFGIKHIKFWSQAGGGLTYRQVALGQKFRQNTVLCCSVGGGEGASEWWLLGLSSGYVLIIKDAKVQQSVKAHKLPLYAILVTPENIWTAGQGGFVCKWDSEMKRCVKIFPVTDHFLEESSAVGLTSSQPGLRSLSAVQGTNTPILVATQHAELLCMDAEGKISVLMQGHRKGEVWGLDTHPRLSEAVTVGDDNTLRRWSLEGQALGCSNLRKTARCVHFHPSAVLLALGYLDGSVAIYLYPSLEKHGGAHHRSQGISDVKFSPNGRFLAVGSHESLVDLYVVDTDGDIISKEGSGLRRVGVCRGASSWITHITWHEDSRLIQINSGAGEQLYYEAPHGTRQLIPDSSSRELAWTSPLTCPLDAVVEGVWAPEMDLTDINAIATAYRLPVVAVATDNQGLLRLFSFPCKGNFKKHRQYRGHSAHVTNVKWSYDDSLVVTTGGADTSVIVWRVRHGSSTLHQKNTSSRLQDDGHALDDIPDEELTIMDLEAAGLEDEDIPATIPATSIRDSKLTRALDKADFSHYRSTHSVGRLRALPTLTSDDKMIFYCCGSVVGLLNITEEGSVASQRVGYGEHGTAVTSMAVSPDQPIMVATAQLGIAEDVSEDQMEVFALVHVWRPSDGVNVAVLRAGPEAVITALSFSPSGRLLASLADASTIHIFNWIKGAHIAHAELKAGMVTAMAHSGETTVAALTPRTILFLDLVGNSLVITRGHASPELLQEEVAFNSLGVSPNGHVYVGCSDGSVVEWKGRLATRFVAAPDSPPTIPPVRMSISVGQGAIFTACRLGSLIVVRCYTTDKDELNFFSDSQIAAPTEDWIPISARLGGTRLILGARKNQPFIVLNLQSGRFTMIEHG